MAAGVIFPLVICGETVGLISFSRRSILSPNGLWRLERDSEVEARTGRKVPFLHLIQTDVGESLLRLYCADWEGWPGFHDDVIDLDLNYCGYRCQTRIDAASRTFVFHLNEMERPLAELHVALDQAMRNAAKIYVPRSKRRKRLLCGWRFPFT